jgi:hypothetical protein
MNYNKRAVATDGGSGVILRRRLITPFPRGDHRRTIVTVRVPPVHRRTIDWLRFRLLLRYF